MHFKMLLSVSEYDFDWFSRMLQLDGISEQASWNLHPFLQHIVRFPPVLGAQAGMSGAEYAISDAGLVEVEQERGDMLTGGGEILLHILQ